MKRRSPAQLGALLLSALALSAPALAQGATSPRVLLDNELRARRVNLVSVTGDTVTYEDQTGRLRSGALAGFVALLPDPLAPTDPATRRPSRQRAPGWLELTDGQRFPGELAGTGGEQDAVRWRHPLLGDVQVRLDEVARVVLDRAVYESRERVATGALEQAERIDDELLLTNGDRLIGLVVSMGDPIEIEVDGEIISLPPHRVAAAWLANPPQDLTGLVVWLDDGSVAVVASLSGDERRGVTMSLPGGDDAQTPMRSLRAVAFEAGRVEPLSALPLIDQRAEGERRLLLHPVRPLKDAEREVIELNAPDIELPGPMTARWSLPEGARRLGAVAELPIDALPWGDCDLVLRLDGEERFRARLHAGNPRVEFSVPMPAVGARELSISVEPGAYGPINDRVILRRPVLLVDG